MSSAENLGRRLREAAAIDVGEGEEAVEAELERVFEAGRSAWPGLALGAEDFGRHIGRHAPKGEPLMAYLAALHAEDFYLACACAARVPGSVSAFQARHGAVVDAALRGRNGGLAAPDELRQVLWEKLFVGRPGSPPKIADYAGRGPLGGFTRIAAVRTALNMREQAGHEELAGDLTSPALEPAGPPALDPELAFLKSHYRVEFKRALEETLAALPSDQRAVLRMSLLDGLSIDRIAAVYGVHRATAARWVVRGQEALLQGTRRLLGERLRVDAAELDSLINLVRSQLDISLGGLAAS